MSTALPIGLRPELRRQREATAYRVLFLATFPVFLIAALWQIVLEAAGLVPGAPGPRSLFGRARSMAHAAIPYCFMG
ncbi:hypothetical protein [Prosthecomicrobium hirschii]|uniref:hypothetical protein n=1 Tax=Prosthecodimorpha hirschii TaxID=665126 RepID=UPI001FCD76DF|nr:hypothetical protein [Prosthecomicrobium hirschii]MCW1842511.1 hypothetical protein [Prosthecomicrobium hirschii]